MEQKVEKKISVFKVISFESATANFHNPNQDTLHRQSVC